MLRTGRTCRYYYLKEHMKWYKVVLCVMICSQSLAGCRTKKAVQVDNISFAWLNDSFKIDYLFTPVPRFAATSNCHLSMHPDEPARESSCTQEPHTMQEWRLHVEGARKINAQSQSHNKATEIKEHQPPTMGDKLRSLTSTIIVIVLVACLYLLVRLCKTLLHRLFKNRP